MSDIRYNGWLHRSGTGGVWQDSSGNVGIGSSVPSNAAVSANSKVLNVGVVTATTYYGSGANLTGITGTTINNNANDRVITGSDTANTLEGESTLFYSTGFLTVHESAGTNANGSRLDLKFGNNNSTDVISSITFSNGAGEAARIQAETSGANNSGQICFYTDNAGTSAERARINSNGQISIRGTSTAFDTTGDLDSLQLYYETDSGQASIGPYSSGGATHLSFYTNTGGNAATEKLRIDSSGNLLLGTTSATSEFTVRGSGTVAAFEGTGGSGSIMIKDVDDSTLAYALVDAGNFDIQTSGSSYSTKLRIDTSGYVTAPEKRQAAFCARVSGTLSNISANGIIIYNTDNSGSNSYQAFDPGGNYNTSDGKFTCPVSGVYYFEAQAMTTGWANGDSTQDLLIMKSNRGTVSNPRQRRSWFRSDADNNGYYTNSVSGLYNATAGDTVWVIVTAGCSVSNLSYSYFSGFLVG